MCGALQRSAAYFLENCNGLGDLPGSLHMRATKQSREPAGKADNIVVCVRQGVTSGLYHAEELNEDGFSVYFQGGLRSDDHFNAHEYWLSISQEENLSLSRSHASTIRNLILRVVHKMITYGLYHMTNGDLDTTTLSELIDYEGRLKPEDPQPGVLRVGITRPPRASMQDLEPITHLDMPSHIMISIISSTLLNHRSSSRMMMMSSVKMTQDGYVTAYFRSRNEEKKRRALDEMT
nr:hypothetical protein [Tanacetum cinerariifolium]